MQAEDLGSIFQWEALADVFLHASQIVHSFRHPVASHPLPSLLNLEEALTLLIQLGKWVRLCACQVVWDHCIFGVEHGHGSFVLGRFTSICKYAFVDERLYLLAQHTLIFLVCQLATVVEDANYVA